MWRFYISSHFLRFTKITRAIGKNFRLLSADICLFRETTAVTRNVPAIPIPPLMGLGRIPLSGLKLNDRYAELDSRRRIDIRVERKTADPRCRCGEVLRGKIDPPACTLFGAACTPERPLGPCMVSSEGSCSAWFSYG
jgi:hypothetical protein